MFPLGGIFVVLSTITSFVGFGPKCRLFPLRRDCSVLITYDQGSLDSLTIIAGEFLSGIQTLSPG